MSDEDKDWSACFDRCMSIFTDVLAGLLGLVFLVVGILSFLIGMEDSMGHFRPLPELVYRFLISFAPLVTLAIFWYRTRPGRR